MVQKKVPKKLTKETRDSRPVVSSKAALARMQAAKPRDTNAELAIRLLLHCKGLRYRNDTRPIRELNRRADIAFPSAKIAVFIDGCFWHGYPIYGIQAKANAEFWRLKIERNQKRDRDTNEILEEVGWKVIRVWEHEDPNEASERIYTIVKNS